jgi:hypothetical protein
MLVESHPSISWDFEVKLSQIKASSPMVSLWLFLEGSWLLAASICCTAEYLRTCTHSTASTTFSLQIPHHLRLQISASLVLLQRFKASPQISASPTASTKQSYQMEERRLRQVTSWCD